MVQPNYSYRANSDNTDEVKAVEQAFAESVLFGFKIEAESDAKLLIDLSPMLMSDSHGVAQRLTRNRQGNYRMDASRSAIYPPMLKNFLKILN